MRYPNKLIKLNIDKVKTLYAVGDIHGEFLTFADDLVNSCKVKNCCVIVCGDIGLGFYSRERTQEFFQKMQTKFAANNIFVIFFRGNHDDPTWFEYIDDEFATDYPNVIIAEDFTIVEHNNENYPYRILLWGGAVSIDRTMRTLGRSYWHGEEIKLLPHEFTEDKEIHCVCTHSAPDFCLPVNSDNLHEWFLRDFQLKQDLEDERKNLGTAAHVLYKANKSTLSLWVYGHYHDIYFNSNRMNDEISSFPTVRFIGLDMMRYTSYDVEYTNQDTYNFYNRKHKNHLLKIFEF